MREKKLRKQLMAIGIQRNDAAGFIRAYREIQKAGKHKLCRDIMNPPMSAAVLVGGRPVMIQRMRVQYAVPDEQFRCVEPWRRKQVEGCIREEMAVAFGRLLIDEAAMLFQQERRPEGCTVFRAEIQVAMPEKKVCNGRA